MRNLKSLSPFLGGGWGDGGGGALARDEIFIKTQTFEIRFVIGSENRLFAGAGVCVQFSARKFYRLGQ